MNDGIASLCNSYSCLFNSDMIKGCRTPFRVVAGGHRKPYINGVCELAERSRHDLRPSFPFGRNITGEEFSGTFQFDPIRHFITGYLLDRSCFIKGQAPQESRAVAGSHHEGSVPRIRIQSLADHHPCLSPRMCILQACNAGNDRAVARHRDVRKPKLIRGVADIASRSRYRIRAVVVAVTAFQTDSANINAIKKDARCRCNVGCLASIRVIEEVIECFHRVAVGCFRRKPLGCVYGRCGCRCLNAITVNGVPDYADIVCRCRPA